MVSTEPSIRLGVRMRPTKAWPAVLFVALALMVSACASGPPKEHSAKPQQPRSEELETARLTPGSKPAYEETGLASWYGKRFHGRRTASGQVYDMNAMTAAHKTLSFGTKVKVTHIASGRSVVVTINDRGPFVRGRIIDLSRQAAEHLGIVKSGVARVRVTSIDKSAEAYGVAKQLAQAAAR